MSSLQLDVDSITQRKRLKTLFYTTAYHFKRRHGSLMNIFRGYEQYPPQPENFFVPPLVMTRYEKIPMLFYNKCHVTPVAFESYDFNRYVTVLNPSPIYETTRNYVVRDNNVCHIVPCFKYREAEHAKLSWCETNDVNEYTFLLNLNEKYYEVLAIYPKAHVEKLLPKLSSQMELDITAMDISKLISRAASNEPTSTRVKEALAYSRLDEVTSELETVTLVDWIIVCVKPYMHVFITDEIISPADVHALTFGEMNVYMGKNGLQFLCKTKSTSFVYSQLDNVDDIRHLQVFFDKLASDSSSTLVKIVRITAMIRSLIHVMCRGSMMISTLNDDDVDLHRELIYTEIHSAEALLDLDALSYGFVCTAN
ncbi:MAG: hypothetical protein ABW185_00520 [Sedimenticola sp.]